MGIRETNIFRFHSSPISPSPHSVIRISITLKLSKILFTTDLDLARLILIDIFKFIFHQRKFPVIAAFARVPGRLPGLFRARSGGAE